MDKLVKNTINDYLAEEDIKGLELNFEQFLVSKKAQQKGEKKINWHRFKQTYSIVFDIIFLWPAILKNYLVLTFLKKYPLRSMEISLTYECNSKCDQCSCRLAYDPSKQRLTLDEFKQAIEDSIKLGAFQFNITGGEPLLYADDCLALIKYIRSRGKYVHLCSNALLMNQEIMKQLKQTGLNSLEMGLDSADEKTHNDNRQANSYQQIMKSIELAKREGIKTIILNTVITHQKIKNYDMLALMNLAKEKGVLLQITPPCVTGAWRNKKDILLDQRERLYLRWLLARYPHSRMDTYSSYTGIRCPAAREKIGIHPYGDVVSCPLIQIVYGNIKEQKLKDIREKMLQNPYYRIVSREGCLPSFNKDFIDKYMSD